ncbi:MAG TPA: sugar-binding transcriptional regulator [Bauldia sp.]|nr:sugar-binding transcriptional regulator [Bauldia sp.]
MARLRRSGGQSAASEDSSLRIRAAWLYYNQGLTQKQVSERLGISRGTAIRVLGEALERGDVQIWINENEAECAELAVRLETAFSLDEAVVVPSPGGEAASKAVGLALGKLLSEAVTDNMTIGVGWGRTLTASLASLRPVRRDGVKVVSLLGGVVEARGSNPLEYSWRMASQFGADCYLFIAPAFVDSVATKRRLIEKCGLDKLYALAQKLDLAVVSAGDINLRSTSLAAGLLAPGELEELVELGAVCDVLCNFLDDEGKSVPHALNRRAMSVELDDLRNARHVVIATGGAHRVAAIRAAIRRIGCNTLVTDEAAARGLLAGESGRRPAARTFSD